jgi:tellurite resistance protein TehA-like permease
MVMATGIVSITSAMLGLPRVAQVLFHLNVLVYLVLWLLTVARIGRHRGRVLADIADHGRGPGFFTVVAGTGVLASQFLLLAGDPGVASGLWLLAIVLWLILTYGIFAALTVKDFPMLLVLGVWRHLLRRFPLRYDPLYWGAVFPLGMYAAATQEMSLALAIDLPAVAALPGIFLTAALLAWALTLVGLGVDRWRRWRPGSVPLR